MLAGLSRLGRRGHDNVNIEMDKISREEWESIKPALRPSIFEDDVLSPDITEHIMAD